MLAAGIRSVITGCALDNLYGEGVAEAADVRIPQEVQKHTGAAS